MIYNVYVDNHLVKTYKHKLQATIYCIMNGFVYTGRGYYLVDKQRVRIEEIDGNE